MCLYNSVNFALLNAFLINALIYILFSTKKKKKKSLSRPGHLIAIMYNRVFAVFKTKLLYSIKISFIGFSQYLRTINWWYTKVLKKVFIMVYLIGCKIYLFQYIYLKGFLIFLLHCARNNQVRAF